MWKAMNTEMNEKIRKVTHQKKDKGKQQAASSKQGIEYSNSWTR
jgi:hypothetical protein